MKPGTTRDPILKCQTAPIPILTKQQEEEFREKVAMELYWGPDSLRGFARRWLEEAQRYLVIEHFQLAQRFTLLAADCQAKALELEARAIEKEMAR